MYTRAENRDRNTSWHLINQILGKNNVYSIFYDRAVNFVTLSSEKLPTVMYLLFAYTRVRLVTISGLINFINPFLLYGV